MDEVIILYIGIVKQFVYSFPASSLLKKQGNTNFVSVRGGPQVF